MEMNIVVDSSGVAKLVDFGMSSLNGSSPTAHIGPIRWAAPECVVRNQTSSFHSDKYSLGMSIIEAAIGCDPWGQLSDTGIHYELGHRQFLAQPAQLNNDHWRLITSLCTFEPNQRCTIDFAIDQLEAFALIEANVHLQTSS
ncbi:TKL protein kinase [Phytophthora palmivora]|uniref:TKL protein kinase n=1 Tax=Phytophthora palmivora TaxID=4796 RepID=A0A2P4X218_9STRA|nr:TKL protein kinase [Phytophthora palmivora]